MDGDKKNKAKYTAVEITPASFLCALISCPSVFETNNGTFVLVGKKVNIDETPKEIKNKIGAGETAIEIPKGLITKLFSKE